MGRRGLGKKQEHGDKDYFDTRYGETLIYGKTDQGEKGCEGIPLSGGVHSGIEIGQAQQSHGGCEKEKEPGLHEKSSNYLPYGHYASPVLSRYLANTRHPIKFSRA